MTHTIIFKILQSSPIQNINQLRFLYSENTDVSSVSNWDTNDIITLNNNFKKIVQLNYNLFLHYKNYCNILNPQFYHYIINNKKYKMKYICEKYNKALNAYEDTFTRDIQAFEQEKNDIDVDINVCILFDDEYNYLGHIYCWIVNDWCIGFGIRAKIDNFFNKTPVKISLYLLEGLRKYAIANKCKAIFIPNPLPNMEDILFKNSFKRDYIHIYYIRNPFMGYGATYHSKDPYIKGCIYRNIKRPFIEDPNYGFRIILTDINVGGYKKTKKTHRNRNRNRNRTMRKYKN